VHLIGILPNFVEINHYSAFNIICFVVYRFLPGGNSGSAVSRLDHAAFCGPAGSAAGDQIFTADSFYLWLLTTFDDVCLPLIIVRKNLVFTHYYIFLYCNVFMRA